MGFRVCVLGATGIVGQRFVSLLASHPWFRLEMLVSSRKHAGNKYGEVVRWIIDDPFPEDVGELELTSLNLDLIVREGFDLVFSALPSDIALDVELELVKRGVSVVSTASPLRLDPRVPLLNPEVNADHLELVKYQEEEWSGVLVKVPNCTTAILTLALKPIVEEFGVEKIIVSTMQAVSGAGFSGVPSIAILDNVIPYIGGEEEKVENETLKVLGTFREGKVKPADLKVSASCHRVMVLDGHLEAVFVKTRRKASPRDVEDVLREFKVEELNLPTAPRRPIVVRRELDRPQPRLDRRVGNGMSVVVGRIREDRVLEGVKFVVLGHNTIRGAAGTGILIGELMVKEGIL